MKRIAIFASGTGSNAENIINYFKDKKVAEVSFLFSNKGNAEVVLKAMLQNIPVIVLDRVDFFADPKLISFLQKQKIDLIVLAGFLLKIPTELVRAFDKKIINLHPALLPKYGGKGMYGMRVHQAVINAGETESGITIHYVNEKFDEGEIIFQKKCTVEKTETPESLRAKIQELEYKYFPLVIEGLLSK